MTHYKIIFAFDPTISYTITYPHNDRKRLLIEVFDKKTVDLIEKIFGFAHEVFDTSLYGVISFDLEFDFSTLFHQATFIRGEEHAIKGRHNVYTWTVTLSDSSTVTFKGIVSIPQGNDYEAFKAGFVLYVEPQDLRDYLSTDI